MDKHRENDKSNRFQHQTNDKLAIIEHGKKMATEQIKEGLMRDRILECFERLRTLALSRESEAGKVNQISNGLLVAISETLHAKKWWLLKRHVNGARQQIRELCVYLGKETE